MEDPSEDSEQGSAYGAQASSENHFKDISSAPDETETKKGSLDERATTVGEGQYEHTSWPTPPVYSSPSSFSSVFLFPYLMFSIFQASPILALQIEAETDLSLDLSFLDQTISTP